MKEKNLLLKEQSMERYLLLTERSKKEVLNYLPNNDSIERLAIFFQNFLTELA